MCASRRGALALAVLMAIGCGSSLSAHRRDEYLQAARLAVGPTRVNLELDLTPGIAVADAIIAEIDRDGDGALSPDEKRAYVRRVLSAFELAIDGHPLLLESVASTFPDLGAFRRGEGTIQLDTAVVLPVSGGDHQLAFRNTYRRSTSAYLANALVPESDRVVITAQRRDADQRTLTIDYSVRVDPASSSPVWPLGLLGVAVVAALPAFAKTLRLGRPAFAKTLRQ